MPRFYRRRATASIPFSLSVISADWNCFSFRCCFVLLGGDTGVKDGGD